MKLFRRRTRLHNINNTCAHNTLSLLINNNDNYDYNYLFVHFTGDDGVPDPTITKLICVRSKLYVNALFNAANTYSALPHTHTHTLPHTPTHTHTHTTTHTYTHTHTHYHTHTHTTTHTHIHIHTHTYTHTHAHITIGGSACYVIHLDHVTCIDYVIMMSLQQRRGGGQIIYLF